MSDDTNISTDIFEQSTKKAIEVLTANLNKPTVAGPEMDLSGYPATHLLGKGEGWEAPHKDVLAAYFEHFKQVFPEYGSDDRLARLLGINSGRRIREYKQGKHLIPFDVWRKFLVMTGRVPQEVLPVFAYFSD